MIGFVIWYVLTVVLAGVCIWHEDKLVKIERGVIAGVKQTVKEWREAHDAA